MRNECGFTLERIEDERIPIDPTSSRELQAIENYRGGRRGGGGERPRRANAGEGLTFPSGA